MGARGLALSWHTILTTHPFTHAGTWRPQNWPCPRHSTHVSTMAAVSSTTQRVAHPSRLYLAARNVSLRVVGRGDRPCRLSTAHFSLANRSGRYSLHRCHRTGISWYAGP